MFPVFKLKSSLWKTASLVILLVFNTQVSEAEVAKESIDPSTIYKTGTNPGDVMDRKIIDILNLQIVVYEIDHKDPETHRYGFDVFFRCDEGEFQPLDRSFDGEDPKTYNELGISQIAKDDPAVGNGVFLVLPGFEFNEKAGKVNEQPTLENYPIEDLMKLCKK